MSETVHDQHTRCESSWHEGRRGGEGPVVLARVDVSGCADPFYERVRECRPPHQRQWLYLAVSSSLEPTPEQFATLAARPADAPVVMINLLQFRADEGRQSYVRYAHEVAPHLERVGGLVRYAGTAPTVVIGEGEEPSWDAIIVVEYPSPAAFIDMVTNEEYLKIHQFRAAGLDRGDLIATSVWTMAE
jgi:uncharacterized protein (DUF1330 family)